MLKIHAKASGEELKTKTHRTKEAVANDLESFIQLPLPEPYLILIPNILLFHISCTK